jgi:hypothetical protein
MPMRTSVWLSFDLGVRGDFEGMYQFLDSHGAKDCGNNVGTFHFNYKNDLIAELTESIQASVTFDKRSRVYVIFQEDGKYMGRFIIGRRKSPPWAGFSVSTENQAEVDIGE